ncbi:MAG: hypothetical protein WEB53_13475 [Akkermansiaceae bacterium]
MLTEAKRLIELATRPLAGNAKLLLAAETELGNALAVHAADRPEAVAAAAAVLTRADRHPLRRHWKVALVALTVWILKTLCLKSSSPLEPPKAR